MRKRVHNSTANWGGTPGNYGGETLREYCGLSPRRKLGKRHFEEPGVSAQDLYLAIGRRSK